MKKFFVFCLLLVSCKTLKPDPYPNPAMLGYLGMEFVHDNNRTIGTVDINLQPDTFEAEKIQFVGIWKGSVILKSPACNIDKTIRFNQITTIKIADLIPSPMKCTIDMFAYTDQVGKSSTSGQHNITEHGQVHLNTAEHPVVFNLRNGDSVGQGSFQKSEGSIANDVFQMTTPSKEGSFRIEGCQYGSYEGSYSDNSIVVPLKAIYKKNTLRTSDSCDFEINILPSDDFNYSFVGNLSVNIYSGAVVKLEQPSFWVNRWGHLHVKGQSYVVGVAIDGDYGISYKHDINSYDPNRIYWIRTVTKNGRKSVMAIQHLKVIWSAE